MPRRAAAPPAPDPEQRGGVRVNNARESGEGRRLVCAVISHYTRDFANPAELGSLNPRRKGKGEKQTGKQSHVKIL